MILQSMEAFAILFFRRELTENAKISFAMFREDFKLRCHDLTF